MGRTLIMLGPKTGGRSKPTTLSGKQAGKVKIPVSAIFAAIVMHNVPSGHSLLCANPNSLYVAE
jgi:hypothetical protein